MESSVSDIPRSRNGHVKTRHEQMCDGKHGNAGT